MAEICSRREATSFVIVALKLDSELVIWQVDDSATATPTRTACVRAGQFCSLTGPDSDLGRQLWHSGPVSDAMPR